MSPTIGVEKDFPDLAIEVIITSGGIDKLEVYQRLGVREVWFLKGDRFDLYSLRGEVYATIENSEILPSLDLALLAQYAIAPDPLDAVVAFRGKIRES